MDNDGRPVEMHAIQATKPDVLKVQAAAKRLAVATPPLRAPNGYGARRGASRRSDQGRGLRVIQASCGRKIDAQVIAAA